jgi:hypothetical protein
VTDPANPAAPAATGLAEARIITLEQVSAVHVLMSGERRATEYDILMSTAFEALRSGPQTEAELNAFADRVWPGAGIDEVRMNAALQAAAAAGYIGRMASGPRAWTLTKTGLEEIGASRNWARDAMDRTRDDISTRLEQAGYTATEDQAGLWVSLLMKAVGAGIQASLTEHIGEVEMRGETALAPHSFDPEQVLAVIKGAAVREQDAELLSALALEAFDPLSPFGNDLVMHITVGYMLHAFIARRDNLGGRRAVGSLRGDRALLDTPTLLPLLGPDEQAAPIRQAISAAMRAGMEVIAPQYYLDELQELLERIERVHKIALEEELEKGTDPDLLGQLVDQPVAAMWLRALARGKYGSWDDFRAAADDLGNRLAELGVVVRDHNNQPADHVDRLEATLTAVIEARRVRDAAAGVTSHARPPGRGESQIRRDAETMGMARRRRATQTSGLFWPGAWIISTDTAMRTAHKRLSGADRFPLTITPSQWVGIVSTCSDPASIEDLAKSAATLLSEETFLAIAGGFPVPIAMEVARALSPGGSSSPLDTSLAQMSIEDLLLHQPDTGGGDEAGAKVAAAVVARRSARVHASYEAEGQRHAAEREAGHREVRDANVAVSRERAERHEAEEGRAADRRAAELRDQERNREDILRERRHRRDLAALIGIVLIIAALVTQQWVWAGGTFVAGALFLYQSTDWTRNIDYPWTKLIWAVVIEGIAFALNIVGILRGP